MVPERSHSDACRIISEPGDRLRGVEVRRVRHQHVAFALIRHPRDEYLQKKQNQTGDTSQKELLILRNKVDRANKAHFATYAELVPGIHNLDRVRVSPAGQQELHLPLSLTEDERTLLGVEKLAELEAKLRVGQCYDWVARLRDALGLQGLLSQPTRTRPGGYHFQTRSEAQNARASALVQRAARLYRRSWDAATAGKDAQEVKERMGNLEVLRDSDLRTLHSLIEGGSFNPKGLPVSWIWRLSPSLKVAWDGEIEEAIESWCLEGTRCI